MLSDCPFVCGAGAKSVVDGGQTFVILPIKGMTLTTKIPKPCHVECKSGLDEGRLGSSLQLALFCLTISPNLVSWVQLPCAAVLVNEDLQFLPWLCRPFMPLRRCRLQTFWLQLSCAIWSQWTVDIQQYLCDFGYFDPSVINAGHWGMIVFSHLW